MVHLVGFLDEDKHNKKQYVLIPDIPKLTAKNNPLGIFAIFSNALCPEIFQNEV